MEGDKQDQRKKAERFFQMIEAGDIELFDIFPESVLVFGFTKVGKTSTCHILCKSPLRAYEDKGDLYYKAETMKYPTARIGHETNSETEIPNIFPATVMSNGKPKRIVVLDQPGYGDTYGFYRVFSNGYFHYRTFSKTPKVKFVLAVTKFDLTGTGQKFKETIIKFVNSFSAWDEEKKDADAQKKILKAISLIVTKAEPGTKSDNIRGIISNLRDSVAGMGPRKKDKFQSVLDELLASGRIYFIERPRTRNQNTLDSPILQQIYDSSSFWERQVTNIVDMSQVNFSVSGDILNKLRDKDNELFKIEFQNFLDFIEDRCKNIFINNSYSLVNVVKTLERDAVTSSESREFLGEMQELNKQFYTFLGQYNKRREELEVSLFNSPEADRWLQLSPQDMDKEMKSVYFIKKFKVLQFLNARNHDLEDLHAYMDRSIQTLQSISNIFLAIFKMFSLLRTKSTDKTIFKYSYIVQRAFEESKILTLIIFNDAKVEEQVRNLGIRTFSEDIYRMLIDKFFSYLSEINIDALKEEFISEIDFSQLTSVNQESIKFFESISNKSQNIQFKLSRLIIEYSSSLLKNKLATTEEKKFAISKLFKYRNNFYAYMKNIEDDDFSKDKREKLTELIVILTNALANVLQTFQMYQDARECYQSVNNAELIFQMYDLECKNQAANPEKQMNLLLKEAKEASKFHRKELAMKCCQQAYALCTRYSDMQRVKAQILRLCTEKDEEHDDQDSVIPAQLDNELTYLQRFSMNKFCTDLSDDLKEGIEAAFGEDDD